MLMTQKERLLKQAKEDVKNILIERKKTTDSEKYHRLSRTIALKQFEIKKLEGK